MAMFREDFLEEVIFRCVFNGCEEIASKGPREGQGRGNHAGPCTWWDFILSKVGSHWKPCIWSRGVITVAARSSCRGESTATFGGSVEAQSPGKGPLCSRRHDGGLGGGVVVEVGSG